MTKRDENENDDSQRYGNGEGVGATVGGQFGHHGFARTQFGQRGWLRPAILKLIQEKPMNGMEIINRFNEASHGWWKPSPGSIYPLLENLEKEGITKKRADGRYEVTKKFTSSFGPIGQVDEMLTNMEGTASYFEEMAKSDKVKFSLYKKRIEKLAERLSEL
jgi:hypothetical protein